MPLAAVNAHCSVWLALVKVHSTYSGRLALVKVQKCESIARLRLVDSTKFTCVPDS